MRSVTILGSTGSVGAATLDVVKSHPDKFSVSALTAQSKVELLAEQAKSVHAKLAVIGDESLHSQLKDALAGTGIKTAAGKKAIIDAASEKVDYTMAAIVGMAGLEPMLAAIANGRCVAIANKEPMVAAGKFVMAAAKKSGATLLPVDSEHNAIFQIFDEKNKDEITRIILTASGGPFREWPISRMEGASPKQAIAHPNWTMGAKISVDSASLMNKALEVIEAHFMFDMLPEKIEVLVHPQSVIHSMVEYSDGSVLAQMGASDMRVPITHTLGWPNRMNGPAQRLDFTKISSLTFEPVDHCRFPAINYAYDCLEDGQAACIAMNAANEEAVASFLAGNLGFLDIFETVRKAVDKKGDPVLDNLGDILVFDEKMRNIAKTCILENKSNASNTNRKVS